MTSQDIVLMVSKTIMVFMLRSIYGFHTIFYYGLCLAGLSRTNPKAESERSERTPLPDLPSLHLDGALAPCHLDHSSGAAAKRSDGDP